MMNRPPSGDIAGNYDNILILLKPCRDKIAGLKAAVGF